MNGSNDPYWQVDALSHYWNSLTQPKWVSIVPNAGHILGDKLQAHEALCAFAQSVAGRFKMPTPTWEFSMDAGLLRTSMEGAIQTTLWVAVAHDLDFRESEWKPISNLELRMPTLLNIAAFLAGRHSVNGNEFTLTSPVAVYRFQPRRRN